MRTIARGRLAALGIAALAATVGIGWRAATVPEPASQPVRTAARAPFATSTTATTAAPVTTTTAAPTTTTTAPPPPPTTTVARTTTTTRRVTTTTRSTPPPTTLPPTTPPAPPATTALQSQLLNAVNARRATGTTCGGTWYPAVPALTLQSQLTSAAQGHAVDMATRNYFSHDGPDGSSPESRIAATGYRANGWAENIAAGQTSVDEVMGSWWSSPAHCEDFMAGFVSQVGFGLAQSSSSTYGLYWVADMANPG